MSSRKRSWILRTVGMKIEILTLCNQLVGTVANGIYQGIIVTVLVALSLRVLGRNHDRYRSGGLVLPSAPAGFPLRRTQFDWSSAGLGNEGCHDCSESQV